MSEQAEYTYDVFISYSHADRAWVWDKLLSRLEGARLRVCIDDRDFEPGLPSLVNMENAVERSRKTLIVLTPAWVESEWTTFESLLIQTDDPAGRRARMIPLRLKPCKLPKRIAMLTYVDFTEPSGVEFQSQRLVAAIRGEPMPDGPRPAPERAQDGRLFEVEETEETAAESGVGLKYKIHLEGRTEGVVIGDAARIEQRFEADTPQNRSQTHRLTSAELYLTEPRSLVKKENRSQTHRLTSAERRAYLEAELAQYERNLADLRLQKAKYGLLAVPIALSNEIRDTEAEIARIKVELQELNRVLEAEVQKRELYDQGVARFERGEWTQAIYLFQMLLDTDKYYKDAFQKLAQAKKQERLEQFHARAKRAEAHGEWQVVITLCREIIGIAPFYRNVQWLLWKARFHSARQCAGAIWAHHKTGITLLAVLLLIVAGTPVLGKQIVGVWWQPTSTPPTPQVNVEAFLVTKGENPTVTVEPGTTITTTIEEIVQIQVEVSATYEEQEKNFVFIWYTCKTGSSPVLQRMGNPEMLYIAPSEPGADCIRVVIEKGGVLLDRDEIFVDVQK